MQLTEKAKQTIITAAIAVASTAALIFGGMFIKNKFWPAKPDVKSAINVVFKTDAEKDAQLKACEAKREALKGEIEALEKVEKPSEEQKKELTEKKAEAARYDAQIKAFKEVLEANKKNDKKD